MSLFDIVLLFAAGTAAGTINTVVGSGSLITFPTLLALGYPPVLANVTNNVGVLPGSISGAIAYRRELKGSFSQLAKLSIFSALGGGSGALLLLTLPAAVFDSVVPILIIFACILVIASPWLKAWASARELKSGSTMGRKTGLMLSTGLTGVYGGYFGAAQGVILLSLLSVLLDGGMQKANAYKNVLAAFANGAAAVVFLFTTQVAWLAAGIIALGAIVGGQIGGRIGQRIPPLIYRAIIVVIGLVAVAYFYLP